MRDASTELAAPEKPVTISGEKARGGEIILTRPAERWIFIAGLVAAAVVAIVLRILFWR